MMKAAVLCAALLWVINESVATTMRSSGFEGLGVKCNDHITNCSCFNRSSPDMMYVVNCPKLLLEITPEKKYIYLQCNTYDDPFSMIPGLDIKDNASYTVRISSCPLPNTTVKEVMESIGFRRLKSLQIDSSSSYGDSLQKKHFEKLYDITNLKLDSIGLTSLPRDIFEDMGNLRFLKMEYNNFFPSIEEEVFSFTPKLEKLEIGYNNLTDLKTGLFKNLSRLRLMNLTGNKLLELTNSVFQNVKNLEYLDLSSNKMGKIGTNLLVYFNKLKKLNLSDNAFVSLPQMLLNKKNDLEEFVMQKNKGSKPLFIPDGFFSNLPALKTVNLSGSNINFLSKDAFNFSKTIQEIYLDRNQLSTLKQNTFAHLENLIILDLSQNQISSLPGGLFSNNKMLKTLNLQHNQIEIITPVIFINLIKLEDMNLSFNKIKEIKEEFEGLANLKTLDISNNQLTTIAPDVQINDLYGKDSVLKKCTNLEDLKLENNSLTEIYGDWRRLLNRLRTLNLSFNHISRVEVAELNFPSEVSIDLSNNLIKEVDFRDAEEIARGHSEGSQTTYMSDSKTKPTHVNLDNNPFTCNCVMLQFAQFLRNQLDPEVNNLFEINSKNLKCSAPMNLDKTLLSEVPYKLFTCELTTHVSKSYTCPTGCNCSYSPFVKGNLVNCRNVGLQHVAQKMSPFLLANHSELNLEGNQLQRFELFHDVGLGFKNNTHFNLSNNNIKDLSVDHFSTRIKELDISNNNLTMLSDEVVTFLDQAGELELLELHGNPWRCDCDAKPLFRLIRNRYKLVGHVEKVTCSNGALMNTLEESDLCSSNTLLVVCVAFAIFGFLIAILTDLYYRYRTQIKIYLYSCKCKIIQRIVVHPDDEKEKKKRYDAFISFSQEDELFVSEHLVPYLEENEDTKFKLCLHYRDWIPGESIINGIVQSVKTSRRTIVVLSPNFLKSFWGKMEFRTAHAEALRDGQARVIVILYEDVGSINELDEDLKAYLQMNTYLDWRSPWFWQQLKYALPHPPEDADDIYCGLCCIPKTNYDSSSHKILENEQIQNGEVHFNMSKLS